MDIEKGKELKAIIVTPAMEEKKVRVSSKYLSSYEDAEGNYLDGGHNYKFTLPAGIPAKDF